MATAVPRFEIHGVELSNVVKSDDTAKVPTHDDVGEARPDRRRRLEFGGEQRRQLGRGRPVRKSSTSANDQLTIKAAADDRCIEIRPRHRRMRFMECSAATIISSAAFDRPHAAPAATNGLTASSTSRTTPCQSSILRCRRNTVDAFVGDRLRMRHRVVPLRG